MLSHHGINAMLYDHINKILSNFEAILVGISTYKLLWLLTPSDSFNSSKLRKAIGVLSRAMSYLILSHLYLRLKHLHFKATNLYEAL